MGRRHRMLLCLAAAICASLAFAAAANASAFSHVFDHRSSGGVTAASGVASASPAGLARVAASTTPAPVIAIAVVAGLMALAALAYALMLWRGWEPPWLARLRHAAAEAGFRVGATWSEFTDWLRLGR